jgi:hypothetical protein
MQLCAQSGAPMQARRGYDAVHAAEEAACNEFASLID